MARYEVPVTIELELEGDEEAAFTAVDETLQRAWDNDQRYKSISGNPAWHFSLTPGDVSRVEDSG